MAILAILPNHLANLAWNFAIQESSDRDDCYLEISAGLNCKQDVGRVLDNIH